MSYFSLRKPAAEPETEPEKTTEEKPAVEAEKTEGEQPAPKQAGPLLTGLLGPGRWLAAHFGTGTAWGVHVVAVWAVGFYGGWAAVLVPTGWLLAVLTFVPREYLERLAARLERTSPEEDQQAGEEAAVEPLATVLWHLIGDAPGTHLKTIAEHLQAAAPEQPVDRAAVRAKLGALGIPVRASVRDAAGRVNEGVHRADLQAWEEAPSPTEAAPPPGPRSDACSDAVTCDVGKDATAVATPRPRLRRLLSRGVQ